MKISEFAKRTGLSKDTIRYYEKIQLIQPTIQNKQRDYTEDDVETIETILKLKDTGFSLKEIKLVLDWGQNTNHTRPLTEEEISHVSQLKTLFREKYDEIVLKEKRINEMKQVLRKAERKLDYLLDKNRRSWDKTQLNKNGAVPQRASRHFFVL